MTADFGAYVQRTVLLPWEWGVQDCTMWAADWCRLRWSFDPAAQFRGTYHDEAGAERMIAGGLIRLVGPHIALARKHAPAEGDLGVIEVLDREVAAVWSGEHWHFRKPHGVGLVRRPALAIWGD